MISSRGNRPQVAIDEQRPRRATQAVTGMAIAVLPRRIVILIPVSHCSMSSQYAAGYTMAAKVSILALAIAANNLGCLARVNVSSASTFHFMPITPRTHPARTA